MFLHWRLNRARNLGDAASPWLAEQLSGEPVLFAPLDSVSPYCTAIGSFLAHVGDAAQVWGTGFISETDEANPRATYHAVRGPLSREKVIAAGGECPPVWGDPLSLLSLEARPMRPLGVVPHWRERGHEVYDGLPVLDIESPTIAADIAGCERVVTSSLHALVCAHAAGVPAAWVRPTTLPLGDGFKFRDYLAGVGLDDTEVVPLCPRRVADAADRATLPRQRTAGLLEACPFGNRAVIGHPASGRRKVAGSTQRRG